MPMTTEDALVRAVLDHPAEDTPRLAYADYLDETPTPKRKARAAFIRKQIEVATTIHTSQEVDQENELLKKWGAGWLPKLTRGDVGVFGLRTPPTQPNAVMMELPTGSVSYLFERGFIESVHSQTTHELPVTDRSKLYIAQMLATNPITEMTISIWNRTPRVVVRIEIISGVWEATILQDFEMDGEEPERVAWINRETRRELVREIPGFIEQIVPQLDYEQVNDYSEIPF